MFQKKGEEELRKCNEKIAKTQLQLESITPQYEALRDKEEECTQQWVQHMSFLIPIEVSIPVRLVQQRAREKSGKNDFFQDQGKVMEFYFSSLWEPWRREITLRHNTQRHLGQCEY